MTALPSAHSPDHDDVDEGKDERAQRIEHRHGRTGRRHDGPHRPRSSPRRRPHATHGERKGEARLRAHRPARGGRLDDDRRGPGRARQRRLVRLRRSVHLHHRLPLLRPARRVQGAQAARRARHSRRGVRKRQGLHADGPAGALRAPLRRDRRCRAARRPRARRPDGLPAGHPVDRRRGGLRRSGAGLHGPAPVDPTRRTQPRADGPRRARTGRGHRRDRRRARHHAHPHRRPGHRRHRRPGPLPLGCLLHRDDDPHRALHGPVPALPAARRGRRGLAHRRGPARRGHHRWRLGRRAPDAVADLHPRADHAGLAAHRLRLGRVGAPGLAAPRPPRLPVDLHEGRHDHAARDRHPRRAPRGEDAGGHRVRVDGHRSRLRRVALPLPLHHHRLRRPLRLPRADLLGHHPQAHREGEPGPLQSVTAPCSPSPSSP
ncbi:hypothetical protein SAMN06296429_111171 [Janibacter indicus]|uniref:Uncharacterized protein n=1 Tax=Janibacter indicus TaxID=857417 RepID=A0A1W2CHZ4_9MICO|nr:hypothetical protein SAMN06296429_111171 [Janibacter indicus]